MGLQDLVTVVEHDFTADSVFSVMPKEGTVDLVTMSYSFSMIPNQQGAIANATKLLKLGGLLAIADFFLKGNYDDCLPAFARRLRAAESLFHKWWFSMDHVHLLGDKQLDMGAPELEPVWDNRFRGSVPFLPFLRPYHGVYILKKKGLSTKAE
jgi:S-adenosylmethionine-diacylgycerolhomoserine-N-methlytransferase